MTTDAKHLRWSYLSTITTSGMQLVAAVTITRFLKPADYGLAAMAILCANMAGYFTQLGVGRALVQKAVVTRGNLRAAFTLAMATGLVGFVVLCALSPLLARYFHEKRLTPIIVCFGLNLIFQSSGLTSSGLLRRELRIRDLALCDFLAYLLSTFGVGLPMAMHGYGVWALVGSNVSEPFIATIAYYVARPHPILPTFLRRDYEHIAAFSGKASFTTAIEAIGISLDMGLMGRLVSPQLLGLYGRSLTLSTLPFYQLSMGLSRVFSPTLARAIEGSRDAGRKILISSERQLMALLFPMCAAAAIAAPTIVPVIFGRQWTAAIPIYRALCVVGAFEASFSLPALQLEISNEFRHKIVLQGSFAAIFGLCIFFLAPRYGIFPVTIAYAILQAIRSLLFHRLSAATFQVSSGSLLVSWVPGLACSAVLGLAVAVVQHFLPAPTQMMATLKLIVQIVLSLVVISVFYRLFYKDTVYDLWRSLFNSSPAREVTVSAA